MPGLFESLSGSDDAEGGDFVRAWDLDEVDWSDQFERIYIDPQDKAKIVNYGLLEQSLDSGDLDGMTLSRHGAILLSGPPGTGKTTLARGGGYELANRLDRSNLGIDRVIFKQVEMRHLFSKSHGDSPKLVKRVFEDVLEQARGSDTFQVLLLDEVESLFSNRGMLTETDPMDAIRAVNMALDSLDALADVEHVYVISTSNQPGTVDSAFVDRIDEQIHVGLPNAEHREQILADVAEHLDEAFDADLSPTRDEMARLVELSEGFSGRRLRKTVLSALARSDDTVRDPGALTVDVLEAELEDKQRAPGERQADALRPDETAGGATDGGKPTEASRDGSG